MEHSICNEDDYRSLCPLQGSYILKEEDAQDEGVDAFSEGPQLNVDHIYKDELCEMLKPFNLVLDKNGNVWSYKDCGFFYIFIEEFLQSLKKEIF